MFERIKQWVSEHPYLAAGIAVAVVIFVWLFFIRGSSSSSTTASTTDPNSDYYDAEASAIQSGDALQAAQLASNAQAAQTAAQVSANATNDATQIGLAQIAAGAQSYQVQQQAAVDSLNINANATTTQQANTLSAQVQNNTIAANESIANTQMADYTSIINNQTASTVQMNQANIEGNIALASQESNLIQAITGDQISIAQAIG
jgi:hypothetical protein